MYYFSYGSNMSINRLRDRVPSATKIGTGTLKEHKLKFHKVSNQDGSAKCDAEKTGNPDHIIYGVVYQIAAAEKPELDKIEGLGYGYDQKNVSIELQDGTIIAAFTYFATNIDSSLKPFDWYKKHVLRGARENDLPEEYIQKIQTIEMEQDTDKTRRERELSVYR